ncbi:MAG TPA: M48 family metalloprotease [Verrucomicrobiae bacterium]|nr:M48 family metalloprotease [Verrucomicrobiae bacterium]
MRVVRFQVIIWLLLGALSSCVNNVPRITSEEEKRIKEQLEAESKQWQEKQQARVEAVASRLIESTGTQTVIRFVFAAKSDQVKASQINLDAVNAWTDGKTVWVTRGMLRFLKSDDELAAVLGHEMGHALRGHIRQGLAQEILGTALAVPAGIFGGSIGQQVAARMVQLATARFDRDREREADLYGLLWAHRAGYDVDQGKEVFKRIAIEMPGSMEHGFLSTHPTAPERFLALDKIAGALKAGEDPLKVFGPKAENLKSEEKIKEEEKAKADEKAKTEEKPAEVVGAEDEDY